MDSHPDQGVVVSELFYSNPYAVTCFELVTFRDINIEPENIGVILGRILRHNAVLVAVDVSNKLNLGFKFQNFCHDKRGMKRKNVQIARGVTIQVVLFE
jgi:hypothetical protein